MDATDLPAFCGPGPERAAHLREDALKRWSNDPRSRAVALWRGKPLCDGAQGNLCRLARGEQILSFATHDPIFLGMEGERALFGVDVSTWESQEETDTVGNFYDPSVQGIPGGAPDKGFADLRAIMNTLDAHDAAIAATARALMEWHKGHTFCCRCGKETRACGGGWQRECPSCDAKHFPRTDPVVIMLITHNDRCLLGRSIGFPEGFFSCLAGFVEPGETIEAAVRREVKEESGIDVGKVRYLTSQPWPFPSNLMIGCHGDATSDEISVDREELEEALWISRAEARRVLNEPQDSFKLARAGSIAYCLISRWALGEP